MIWGYPNYPAREQVSYTRFPLFFSWLPLITIDRPGVKRWVRRKSILHVRKRRDKMRFLSIPHQITPSVPTSLQLQRPLWIEYDEKRERDTSWWWTITSDMVMMRESPYFIIHWNKKRDRRSSTVHPVGDKMLAAALCFDFCHKHNLGYVLTLVQTETRGKIGIQLTMTIFLKKEDLFCMSGGGARETKKWDYH